MPPLNDDPVIQIHENRLLRLEESMSSIGAAVATVNSQLGHLAEKIDEGFKDVHGELAKGTKLFEGQAESIKALQSDVKVQQDIEDGRKSRWRHIKSVAYFCAAGAGGVIITKFSEVIWTWMGG